MSVLHKPPRVGVEQLVVNLHWTTQNVNLTTDYAHLSPNNFLVDSKDAKAKIQSDVAPVQRPGKTWRKVNLPDHDWSKSNQTSVTPMTHLFLDTDMTLEETSPEADFYRVRMTGKAVTLLNLSFFEPQTVERVFNEIFVLLTNPALDSYFRNPDSGKLKDHFVFIVNNGPCEAPVNPLVKMWLVRLVRVLGLKSVTQKSFAELHSKRNFVERVHAVHNAALSNEQFSSKAIHNEYKLGDNKHLENMEDVANKIQECLSRTQYGGKPCLTLRGIGKDENFIFNDSHVLVNFLAKNENQKHGDETTYSPVHNDLWNQVSTLWDLDCDFVGSYSDDYEILENTWHEEGEVTSWTNKYSTTIFNPDMLDMWDSNVLKMQPVPDYVRWLKTYGELHYLPLAKLEKLETQMINNTPAAFLPSKLLEMVFKVRRNGIDHVIPSIAFLSWCSLDDVNRFYSEFKERLDKTFLKEKEREYWSQEEIYREKKKEELQCMCKKYNLDVRGNKYECVQRLAQHLCRKPPPPLPTYDGNLSRIPTTVTEIKKLSAYKLQEILRYHNTWDCGTKDELALRVGMLKWNRKYLIFHKEAEALKNIMTAVKTLLKLETEMYLEDAKIIHRRRFYFSQTSASLSTSRPRECAAVCEPYKNNCLIPPENTCLESLEEVLRPLEFEISLYGKENKTPDNLPKKDCDDLELAALRTVGARVLAKWDNEQIGDSGWKTGMLICILF